MVETVGTNTRSFNCKEAKLFPGNLSAGPKQFPLAKLPPMGTTFQKRDANLTNQKVLNIGATPKMESQI